VGRRFDFNPFEYTLGLMTVGNRLKQQGRVFKRLAGTCRGRQVIIPDKPPPPPPAQRPNEATWQWMLEWMDTNQPGFPRLTSHDHVIDLQ